jgi:hypothetical protein
VRKYKAPSNLTSVFVGGSFYQTDEKGVLTVPDGVDIDRHIRPLGFTDYEPDKDGPSIDIEVTK